MSDHARHEGPCFDVHALLPCLVRRARGGCVVTTSRRDAFAGFVRRRQADDAPDRARVTLVKVPSGVAAGAELKGPGNSHMESWALFISRDQFDAYCADDPLRFSDPLQFARIQTEIDHVFDGHESQPLRF